MILFSAKCQQQQHTFEEEATNFLMQLKYFFLYVVNWEVNVNILRFFVSPFLFIFSSFLYFSPSFTVSTTFFYEDDFKISNFIFFCSSFIMKFANFFLIFSLRKNTDENRKFSYFFILKIRMKISRAICYSTNFSIKRRDETELYVGKENV